MTSLAELLSDHQLYHSDFQMDFWITLRSGGTPYGCYRQALREIWKRSRGMSELRAQRDLLRLDIEELRPQMAANEPTFGQRRAQIELRRKRCQLRECRKALADTRRELDRFVAQARELRDLLGITTDNPLSPERRAELDRQMWAHRLRQMAAVDYATQGRLGRGTIELLAACPREMRQALAADLLGDGRRLIDWYLTCEPAADMAPG
jgi:hypothetical protein